MFKNIIGDAHRYNTRFSTLFTSTIDAGYYGQWNKSPKKGAISVSVQLEENSFRKFMPNMSGFGFLIIEDVDAEKEEVVYSNEIGILKNRNGSFNTVIYDIPEKCFDKTIWVIPFVNVTQDGEEEKFYGESIEVSVYENGVRTAKNLRWLGEKI